MRRHRQTLLVTTLVLVFVTLWWMMSDSNDKMNAAGIDVSNQINFKVFNSDRGTWETRVCDNYQI
jgi:high-affinity Fe2+/Pb2+ permease